MTDVFYSRVRVQKEAGLLGESSDESCKSSGALDPVSIEHPRYSCLGNRLSTRCENWGRQVGDDRGEQDSAGAYSANR